MQFASVHGVSPAPPLVRAISTDNFRLSERSYAPSTLSPMHTHRNHYIIITLNGEYASTFGTRTESYRPWTVSYHPAGTPHTSRYGKTGAKVLYVEIPAEQLRCFGQEDATHLSTISLHGGLVELTARHLYDEFDHPDQLSPVVLDSFVLQLFAQVCRHSRQPARALPSWLGKAEKLIRTRFMEPLSLASLASAVHVHPVHLAREFRRHYRCTVGEQIHRLRIEFACEQLRKTSMNLLDIALAAGFADQSHFSVAFKKQIGTTPSRFRAATQTDLSVTRPH